MSPYLSRTEWVVWPRIMLMLFRRSQFSCVCVCWQTDSGRWEHTVPLRADGDGAGHLHRSHTQRSQSFERLHPPTAHPQLLPLLSVYTAGLPAEPPHTGNITIHLIISLYAYITLQKISVSNKCCLNFLRLSKNPEKDASWFPQKYILSNLTLIILRKDSWAPKHISTFLEFP